MRPVHFKMEKKIKNKNSSKNYHTVGTVSISNRGIIDTPNTYIQQWSTQY